MVDSDHDIEEDKIRVGILKDPPPRSSPRELFATSLMTVVEECNRVEYQNTQVSASNLSMSRVIKFERVILVLTCFGL